MNATDLLTWPVRPLMTRILKDLDDFAGIKWRHVHRIGAVAAVVCFFQPAPILAALTAFTFLAQLSTLDRHHTLVVGKVHNPHATDMWFVSALTFWLAVVSVLADPLFFAGFLAVTFTNAALAYGYEGGDNDGEPFVVRAWNNVKAAATALKPTAALVGQ